jgi:NAD(P) transhydrogenase subunit beta
MKENLIQIIYIASAILFIFGLKMMSRPTTAVRGNLLSAVGMGLAIVATLMTGGLSMTWIVAGLVIGGVIGTVAALKVPMTSMPEFVAVF